MNHLKSALVLLLALLLAACSSSDEATAPSQETFTVGLVVPHPIVLEIFENYRLEMAELGYVDGENVTYIQKGPPERFIDLLPMPSQLVEEDVDLMIVMATEGAILAQAATEEIPIVFIGGATPVEAGIVESVDRPGANVTGIMVTGPESRRMEIFLEIVPTMKRLYLPHSTGDVMADSSVAEIQEIAETFGVELVSQTLRDQAEMEAAMQNIPDDVDGIFIPQDLLIASGIEAWADAAIDHKLPISMPGAGQGLNNDYSTGGLMGYGVNIQDLAQRTAYLSDLILQGANPGDLPLETAEFYLGVNLHTADLIGVEIPEHILEQAHFIVYDEE